MKNLNKMNKFLVIAVSFLAASTLFAAEEYKGTVITLTTEKYSTTTNAYDRGWILNLARLGQIVEPDVVSGDGKILNPGTLLINGDPATWQCYYDAYKEQYKYALENKEIARKVYEMYQDLANKRPNPMR